MAALVCNLAALLPPTGSICSFLLLLYLVRQWTSAKSVLDCLLAVIVAWALSIMGATVIMDMM
jgi:hypothetical protein